MNTETGQLVNIEDLQTMPPEERGKYVEVTRQLTNAESLNRQIKLYSPCGCGSGKKFKFCCHRKS